MDKTHKSKKLYSKVYATHSYRSPGPNNLRSNKYFKTRLHFPLKSRSWNIPKHIYETLSYEMFSLFLLSLPKSLSFCDILALME